jgi:hypothetical protein
MYSWAQIRACLQEVWIYSQEQRQRLSQETFVLPLVFLKKMQGVYHCWAVLVSLAMVEIFFSQQALVDKEGQCVSLQVLESETILLAWRLSRIA